MTTVEIIIPTYNEVGNVRKLMCRLHLACDYPVTFIDDGTDDLPETVEDQAQRLGMDAVAVRRSSNTGGLSGAVVYGLSASRADVVVVMDGDGQHPPETIERLVQPIVAAEADLVAASRYGKGGSSSGLSSAARSSGSKVLTLATRALIPTAQGLTDPLTGFFAVRREAINVERLQPGGFKILLEIVGTHKLRLAETPFAFEQRNVGESKMRASTVAAFAKQLARLRNVTV